MSIKQAIDKSIEELVDELSNKVWFFAGNGQYEEDSEEDKAYKDGVKTAITMMRIDLMGTPKNLGMLKSSLTSLLQAGIEENERRINNIKLDVNAHPNIYDVAGWQIKAIDDINNNLKELLKELNK